MTLILATAVSAPNLSGLATNGDIIGDGIKLSWTNPASKDLFAIEVWVAGLNDRAYATLLTTVIGTNNYVHAAVPNTDYYYWIRGVTVYGHSNGAFYPTSATAGVYGKNLTPWTSGAALGTGKIGDGTWQNLGTIAVYNESANYWAGGTFLFIGEQVYTADSNTQFRITITGSPYLSSHDYTLIAGRNYTPSIAFNVNVQTNVFATPYTFQLEWNGADSNVTLTNYVMKFIWDN